MKLNDGFDPATEKQYREGEILLGLREIRRTFVVFAILFASFAIADYFVVREHMWQFFFIRFVVVIPLFVATIILSYKSIFIAIHQYLLLANFAIAGAGISFMLIMEPSNVIYYGGMFMIYFSGYLLLKLSFLKSMIGGGFTLLFYMIGFVVKYGEVSPEFIFSSMFFVGANVIGMIGNYNIESNGRKNFLSTKRISEHNHTLKDEVDIKKEEINAINVEIVFALARLAEARDQYTGTHLETVGEYCGIIAEALPGEELADQHLSRKEYADIIRVSSALHDVGKVGVSDTILKKNGKLTETEFEQMKTHSAIGWEILEKVRKVYPHNEFINMGVMLTKYHHERYDGSGYPERLNGKEIPLSARIMALCDTYDAVTSKRSYKDAQSHETALEIIRNESGRQFDPVIVRTFLETEEMFRKVLSQRECIRIVST
jgi:HD-GYP domain-containing protein (c-di-GMP phosphodiesterase class II)